MAKLIIFFIPKGLNRKFCRGTDSLDKEFFTTTTETSS